MTFTVTITAEEYRKEKTRLMKESAEKALRQAEKRDYVRNFRGRTRAS